MFTSIVRLTLLAILRDRVMHALVGVAALLLLLVPTLSLFSMRQAQELATTLSLSAISFILLVFATLLGSSAIWRDIERRYTAAVLGLPLSRATYVLGKFAGIALFLTMTALVLGLASTVVILIARANYPSQLPSLWGNIAAAILFDSLKYVLLTAVALLFSALSTSLFLPIFGTLGIWFASSASQEVMDYLNTDAGKQMPALGKFLIKTFYYLIPNFEAFNLKVHAIYALPLSASGLAWTLLHFTVYTGILLAFAVFSFTRRELP